MIKGYIEPSLTNVGVASEALSTVDTIVECPIKEALIIRLC